MISFFETVLYFLILIIHFAIIGLSSFSIAVKINSIQTEPATTKKSPGALLKDISPKAPKIDSEKIEKIKTWVTDFANSEEAQEAMENLKTFAGKAGEAGLKLAKTLGEKAGETLKEMKDAKGAESSTTTIAAASTPPPSFVVEEEETEEDFLSP